MDRQQQHSRNPPWLAMLPERVQTHRTPLYRIGSAE